MVSLIGYAFVAAFRGVLGSEAYVRGSLAFVWFVLVFAREFLVANVKVAWDCPVPATRGIASELHHLRCGGVDAVRDTAAFLLYLADSGHRPRCGSVKIFGHSFSTRSTRMPL